MLTSPPVHPGEGPVAPAASYMPPGAAAVAALRSGQCRWPIGRPDTAGFAFCGAPRLRPGTYCQSHAGLSHRCGPAAGARS